MSQSIQPEVRGWLQHQRAVNRLLRSAKERNIVSALYLYGPPTSELETSLVDHIVQQAKAGLAPGRVVYITGTELDFECARRRPSVTSHLGPNDYTGVLTIRAAKQFCDEHAQGRAFADDDLVLMIDVRMAATVAEELMFGLVLDRLRQALRARDDGAQVHIAVFLLGSSWFSERTFQSFAAIMQVARRPVQATRPPVGPTFCTDADLDRILGEALRKGQRIVSCRDASWNPFNVSDQVADFRDNDGQPLDIPMVPGDNTHEDWRSIHECRYVQVDPHSSFSTSTGVGVVMSHDRVTSEVLDPHTSQVVRADRQLTKCEWDNVLGWAQKAVAPVQHFHFGRREALEELKSGDEVLGPAWSTDLMSLVLQTVRMMGSNGERLVMCYPIQIPANHAAWADRFRRLVVTGCLRPSPDNRKAYILTEYGERMSHLTWTHNLDWTVASLLLRANHAAYAEDDATSAYILVCMAAILTCGPRSFVSKIGALTSRGTPYTRDDLRTLCSPRLGAYVNNGALWLCAGIFLKNRDSMQPSMDPDADTSEPDAYILISRSTGVEIKNLVARFCGICGVGQPPDEETPLTGQQAHRINVGLMWAFLHRTAYFGSTARDPAVRALPEGTILAKDLVSLRDVRVDQGSEFLPVEACRSHGNRTTQGGGFYAIYTDIYRYDENEPYYVVKNLTRVPSHLFEEVEAGTGIPWPMVIRRPLAG